MLFKASFQYAESYGVEYLLDIFTESNSFVGFETVDIIMFKN